MKGSTAWEAEGVSTGSLLEALSGWTGPDGPLRHLDLRDVVTSTNALALDDGREGLLMVAREQTGGRGRHGSRWVSPPGGLYISYVPTGELRPPRPTDLSLLAALGVADAVDEVLHRAGYAGVPSMVKWPNDVLVGDGKVAGVLLQSRGNAEGGNGSEPRTVVGIGVNVNARVVLDPPEECPPDEWPVNPGSLDDLAGGPLDLGSVLVTVVGSLFRRFTVGLVEDAMDEYRSRCITLGKRVAFTEGGQRMVGTARGISPDGGGLVVEMADGELRELRAGDVRHVRTVHG